VGTYEYLSFLQTTYEYLYFLADKICTAYE